MTPRPNTLSVLAEWAADRHGELPALRSLRARGPSEVSYVRLRDEARTVGRALIGMGVGPGDRVAILAETRAEWTYAHLGVLAAGAVVVPVYPTAGADELVWVLADSGASVVLCEDAERVASVERLRREAAGGAAPGGDDGAGRVRGARPGGAAP
ncbi:AMP-binding protein [Streptomyces sp. PmtG]